MSFTVDIPYNDWYCYLYSVGSGTLNTTTSYPSSGNQYTSLTTSNSNITNFEYYLLNKSITNYTGYMGANQGKVDVYLATVVTINYQFNNNGTFISGNCILNPRFSGYENISGGTYNNIYQSGPWTSSDGYSITLPSEGNSNDGQPNYGISSQSQYFSGISFSLTFTPSTVGDDKAA